jgi:hypothetical protein
MSDIATIDTHHCFDIFYVDLSYHHCIGRSTQGVHCVHQLFSGVIQRLLYSSKSWIVALAWGWKEGNICGLILASD